jgi:pilus assembly protein Flp/PilA
VSRFFADDRGATAVEYALIAAAIAGFILLMVFTLGGKVKGLYESAETKFP